MAVIMGKSVCNDCKWKESCQRLARVDSIDDKRPYIKQRDIFEVIVTTCSLKNLDRTCKIQEKEKEDYTLYYCTECRSMHHSNSKIGLRHKRIP